MQKVTENYLSKLTRYFYFVTEQHWCLGYFVCVRLFSCIISASMSYYCNTVRWAWLDWGLSVWLNAVLQCFDTVGWVIRPVKTVDHITYFVLVQTLNPARSISRRRTSEGIQEVHGLENRVYDENIEWQNYQTANRFVPSPLFSLSLHSSLFLFVSVCINMFLFLFIHCHYSFTV